MAYIGNNLTVQQYAPTIAYFNGNGSQTAFTLPIAVVSAAQIIVVIENVIQSPSTAFSVSGTTLTFTSAPPSGSNNIWVEYTSLETGQTGPWYLNSGRQTYTGETQVNGAGYFLNNAAGDARPLYIENSNAAGTPNGSLFIYNAYDPNSTAYNFIQCNANSNVRFIVYGNGNVNTTGTLTTASRGIAKASMPSGSVLQVVNAIYSTETSSATNVQIATGLAASITPLFASSKILIAVCVNGVGHTTNNTSVESYLRRNTTDILRLSFIASAADGVANQTIDVGTVGTTVLDSPATTSSISYNVTFASQQNNPTVYVQRYGSSSTITLMEIAV